MKIDFFARKKNLHYVPHPSPEMQMKRLQKDIESASGLVFNFSDKLFKFFGWCVAVAITFSFWNSTKFGLFLILSVVMFLTLVAYVTMVSFHATSYIANRLRKERINSSILFVAIVIPALISSVIVPRVFMVGLTRLVHSQSCLSYHKDSSNIPQRCRKYVNF